MTDTETMAQGKVALNAIVDHWMKGGIPVSAIADIFTAYTKDLVITVREAEAEAEKFIQ